VAKEQGLRSRAAFKLSQINRQHPILDTNTKVVLDLCAAPGGWTQVASRICGSQTKIVAVDILAIRNLHKPNITTIVGDITTQKCKADISKAISPQQANVVLHDGAPNIGASYEKDAFVQLELAVHALRCATQHLKRGGAFVTKIYRSRDSASFQWVVNQLFKEVTVFKPKASRQQSAEIFYVCLEYLKPDKIDPRLLDPKHIFEFVEGDTTGGGQVSENFNVFHKSWDKQKRQREGYNPEHLDGTMRHIEPLSKFVFSKGRIDAIKILSSCTGFSFQCGQCQEEKKQPQDDSPSCQCQLLLNHPLTTPEIKECAVDLKVLNKGDFKGLMLWREKMVQVLEEVKETPADDDGSGDDGSGDEEASSASDDEEEIQKEISDLRKRKLREKKKIKKKERKLMAKKRRQAALGMDLNAIEVQEEDQFFSLKTLQSTKDLNHVAEVNLDKMTDKQVFGAASDDDEDDSQQNADDGDEEGKARKKLQIELELDHAYERYLETTKNGAAKSGTKAAKRSKKLMREKLAQESHQDHEMLLLKPEQMDQDAKVYAQMLMGKDNSDSDSGDESSDDDGFNDDPLTAAEHARKKQKTSGEEAGNPLIHKFAEESSSVKTARWFSNPLFANIGEVVNSAATKSNDSNDKRDVDPLDDGDDNGASQSSATQENDADEEEKMKAPVKRTKQLKKEKKKKAGLDADDVLAMMPKTDKQKRHDKRLKSIARDERRQVRKTKLMGESEGDFDLAPVEDDDDDGSIVEMPGMTPAKKQKHLDARRLIKAGMGQMDEDVDKSNSRFEVVEQGVTLPVIDQRKYDSDNEDYDSDDYAKTMALGTMMLRKSKAKALVDASYNRFAWNDPTDLPEWFVDDENRHYRPQLPIPEALLAKMKEKQLALSTRPIAKVAEARARKSRKAKLKLTAAKKKADSVANSSDMSEAMKLKSISKALRSTDGGKGKEYVVAKKGGGNRGVKGTKMVDKRMKNDKRSMDRSTKKKRGGKKGGMTGSKKRRNHS
jgi:AdoMet-dependent rRNA methyltransferase SPB1